MYLAQSLVSPRKDRTSDAVVGCGAFFMALTLATSGRIPFLDTIWPNTLISSTTNEHFDNLSVMPLLSGIVRSFSNCLRCVALSLDHSQMLFEILLKNQNLTVA